MAVGSSGLQGVDADPDHTKSELFNFESGSWTEVDSYPYGSGKPSEKAACLYVMLYISELSAYLVIGGWDAEWDFSGTIAMFRNGEWSEAGKLRTRRRVRL